MLRVQAVGLTGRDAEERGIEARDVVQEAALVGRDGAGAQRVAVVQGRAVPAVGGHRSDAVTPGAQQLPQLVHRVGAREAARHADHRDRLVVLRPACDGGQPLRCRGDDGRRHGRCDRGGGQHGRRDGGSAQTGDELLGQRVDRRVVEDVRDGDRHGERLRQRPHEVDRHDRVETEVEEPAVGAQPARVVVAKHLGHQAQDSTRDGRGIHEDRTAGREDERRRQQSSEAAGGEHLPETHPVDRADHGRARRSLHGEGGARRGGVELRHPEPREAGPVGGVGHAGEGERTERDAAAGQPCTQAVSGEGVEHAVGRGVRAVALGAPNGGDGRGLHEELERPAAAQQVQPPGAGGLAAQCVGEVRRVGVAEADGRDGAGGVHDPAHGGQPGEGLAGVREGLGVVAVGDQAVHVRPGLPGGGERCRGGGGQPVLGRTAEHGDAAGALLDQGRGDGAAERTEAPADDVGRVGPHR